ncbi:GNAT family N-acetyltransferase [Shewanella frigidimarina]|uniref:GNAT family N-acetyltransferase n=1 Tax=Shewanella frigidimarina TaxID=56812 RepID=UPI003179DA5F
MLSQLNPLLNLSVRPASDDDVFIMAELFYATRSDFYQLGLPQAAVDLILQQQYQLQQMSYKSQFPNSRDYILCCQAQVIGKLTLAINPECLHLIDLVLAPEARSKGFGSSVLDALKYDAKVEKVPIRLAVARDNPRAKALYLQQGFTLQDITETHESMQWQCGI